MCDVSNIEPTPFGGTCTDMSPSESMSSLEKTSFFTIISSAIY